MVRLAANEDGRRVCSSAELIARIRAIGDCWGNGAESCREDYKGNRRLLSMDGGRVTFEWKAYAGGNQNCTMTLDAVEFIRRFLLHILPGRFVRIRQFGFLSNRVRKGKPALCRALRNATPAATCAAVASPSGDGQTEELDHTRCPICRIGHMIPIETLKPAPRSVVLLFPRQDSS